MVLGQRVIERLLLAAARVPIDLVKGKTELLSTLTSNVSGVSGRFVIEMSLKVITNLSLVSKNKAPLFDFPGLLECIEVASRHQYEAVRDASAKLLLNLSVDTKNKSRLEANGEIVDVLLSLSSGSSTHPAIQTLGNLSLFHDNKMFLTKHNESAVIGTLLRVTSSQSSPRETRICSVKILGLMTCNATASKIGNYPCLLVALASLACYRDDLAIASSMTLKKLATHLRCDNPCHQTLLVRNADGSSSKMARFHLSHPTLGSLGDHVIQ